MQVTETMKASFLCCIAGAALVVHLGAAALDVDDCVLNGLKGVNSDAAARMVRQSCENKVANQRRQQLSTKYGGKIDEKLALDGWDSDYANKAVKVIVKNELQQTVTYAELSISAPMANGSCPYPENRKHLYAVKVKPGSRVVLVVPGGTSLISKDGRTSCISVIAVRGREPSMLDVSVGAIEPLTDNQVAAVNQDLSERYAIIDSPVYSPPSRLKDSKLSPLEFLRQAACEAEVKKKYPPPQNEYLEVFKCMTRSTQ